VAFALSPPACMLCCRADVNVDICGPKHEKRGLCVHENCLVSVPWGSLQLSPSNGPCLTHLLSSCISHRFACSEGSAAISCQGKGCSRTFHLPCTSKQGCITQFFHRPDQTVLARPEAETTCIICLEPVDDQISYSTMVWPAYKGAWFHCGCIQVGAGFSCFRCPLCKKRRKFLPETFKMGIPILFRPWELLLCSSCASKGAHRRCSGLGNATASWECNECAAPSNGTPPFLPWLAPALPFCGGWFWGGSGGGCVVSSCWQDLAQDLPCSGQALARWQAAWPHVSGLGGCGRWSGLRGREGH
uniref:Zinc finger PHD-type domain-containing protein n=1 Tax=Apteryx owenii TaxID=8824 RepID=A0A8B9S5M5_APTOW